MCARREALCTREKRLCVRGICHGRLLPRDRWVGAIGLDADRSVATASAQPGDRVLKKQQVSFTIRITAHSVSALSTMSDLPSTGLPLPPELSGIPVTMHWLKTLTAQWKNFRHRTMCSAPVALAITAVAIPFNPGIPWAAWAGAFLLLFFAAELVSVFIKTGGRREREEDEGGSQLFRSSRTHPYPPVGDLFRLTKHGKWTPGSFRCPASIHLQVFSCPPESSHSLMRFSTAVRALPRPSVESGSTLASPATALAVA